MSDGDTAPVQPPPPPPEHVLDDIGGMLAAYTHAHTCTCTPPPPLLPRSPLRHGMPAGCYADVRSHHIDDAIPFKGRLSADLKNGPV